MKDFLIALQFLTVLPLKIKNVKPEDLGASLFYFPVVGLFIGLILAGISYVYAELPVPALAAILIALYYFMTGALHLDGLADTCDGFYGSRPKERILEIMRDSHIGAMGVTGIFLVLLLKFAFLASMRGALLGGALILMTVFSRWALVALCFMSDYARKDGKARGFIEHASKRSFVTGAIFTLLVFFIIAGLKGVIAFMLSFVGIFLFMLYSKKKIGGMTGDTLGAACELSEILVLLSVLIMSAR